MLALETARRLGDEVVAIGIKEEASPEIEQLAARCYWISLGQLSRLIEILKEEGITEVMMAGQVKHAKIFSSIRPDWRLVKLLGALKQKNTDALIGGVAKVLADEGIRLADSTLAVEAAAGRSGRADQAQAVERRRARHRLRPPHRECAGGSRCRPKRRDLRSRVRRGGGDGRHGRDAAQRAASLVNGKPLRLVKVSRRRGHLLFDVPVAGPGTIEVMQETGATALAVDAGRTLLLDRDEMLALANECGIAIAGYELAAR